MATRSARRGLRIRIIGGQFFAFIKMVKTRSEVKAFKKKFGLASAEPFAQRLRVFPVRGGFEIWGSGGR